MNPRISEIKRHKKESLFRKEISELLLEASIDNPSLKGLSVSQVTLSPDKSIVYVFFYSPDGKEFFDKKIEDLKLFKPSLRKALAARIRGRYVPNIVFKYDDQIEKQIKIEQLLDTVKTDSEETES